jgi:FtsP/CotA-like multicopper oxidase with cupredoxin domain
MGKMKLQGRRNCMRKVRMDATRCTVALTFALAVTAWSGAAWAIQYPNDIWIPATGCTNAAIVNAAAVSIPCTGNWGAPGYLDSKIEVINVGGAGKTGPCGYDGSTGTYTFNATVCGAALATVDQRAVYKYIAATDGAAMMADGAPQYIFSFQDLTNVPLSFITGTVPVSTGNITGGVAGGITGATALPAPDTLGNSMFQGKAKWIAPDLVFKEGDHVYLNLVNLGMRYRDDLPDAHTIHWHGKDSAANVFDGEPMSAYGINMSLVPTPVPSTGMPNTPEARDFTYFVDAVRPGTYLYHCHVEASEHMEMGMLGNLIVRPAQDGTSHGACAGTGSAAGACRKFAYDDCSQAPVALAGTLCGASGYDVELMLQLSDFDPAIHAWDATYGNPAPNFGLFTPAYPMMNGRGYPDTLRPDVDPTFLNGMSGLPFNGTTQPAPANYQSQLKSSLIDLVSPNRKVLIRLTDLSVFNAYVLRSEIPFRVVGSDSALLAGTTGADLTYSATEINIGPGQTYDLLMDATGVPTGTYFLYTRLLTHLNNNLMDRGGMMTEIHVH